MRMIELKATLQGGTRVSVTGLNKPVITLRKSSGDQRESDSIIHFGLEEWTEVLVAVRELLTMVEGSNTPAPGSVRHG